MIDASHVKAHPHASGSNGGNQDMDCQKWLNTKTHMAVYMQSGLINKIAITSANVTDANGLPHVAPHDGAVYADGGC